MDEIRKPVVARPEARGAVSTPLFLLLLVVLVSACPAGPNPAVGTIPADGSLAGFWLGLWHGAISPFTMVISLFTDDVSVYEVFNKGNWYDFGFVLGILMFVGGSHGARTASR
jgi:hypothetical protein